MAVEKPIGFIPEQEQAIEQMVEIDGSAFADDLAPNVEMMDDGSAIIGEQEQVITSSFCIEVFPNICVFTGPPLGNNSLYACA